MGKQSQTYLKKHLSLIFFLHLDVLHYKIQNFCLGTGKILSSFNLDEDDIFGIIKNMNSNKFHG